VSKAPWQVLQQEPISYTRLSRYLQCPRLFKLVYLDGLPCPVGPAAQIGTVVHAVIAAYLRDVQQLSRRARPDHVDLARRVGPTIRNLRIKGEITAPIDESSAKELLCGFAAIMPEIEPLAIRGIEEEWAFKINEYQCKAIIDLVLLGEDGTYRIIDWKTGKARNANDFQLSFYALPFLLSEGLGEICGTFAYLGDRRQGARTIVSKDAMETARQVVILARSIERDAKFARRHSPLCEYCGVRSHCRKSSDDH